MSLMRATTAALVVVVGALLLQLARDLPLVRQRDSSSAMRRAFIAPEVVSCGPRSGAGLNVITIMEAALQRGEEVLLAEPASTEPCETIVSLENASFFRFSGQPGPPGGALDPGFFGLKSSHDAIVAWRADVVVTVDAPMLFFLALQVPGRAAATELSVPLVCFENTRTVDGAAESPDFWWVSLPGVRSVMRYGLIGGVLSYCDLVVAFGEGHREELFRLRTPIRALLKHSSGSDRIVSWQRGLDHEPSQCRAVVAPASAPSPVKTWRTTFLVLCRLAPDRRIDVLTSALQALLVREGASPDFGVVIAGEDQGEQWRFDELARRFPENVRLVGLVKHSVALQLLSESDALISAGLAAEHASNAGSVAAVPDATAPRPLKRLPSRLAFGQGVQRTRCRECTLRQRAWAPR